MSDAVDEPGLQKTKSRKKTTKSPTAFRTISEVATELEVPQHVLRFWETKFTQVKPMKRGGGRRYYRPGDIELIRAIRNLLYQDGYTIRGVQRLLRENGVKSLLPNGTVEVLSAPVVDASAGQARAVPSSGPFGVALHSDQGDKQMLQEILHDLTSMRDLLKGASER